MGIERKRNTPYHRHRRFPAYHWHRQFPAHHRHGKLTPDNGNRRFRSPSFGLVALRRFSISSIFLAIQFTRQISQQQQLQCEPWFFRWQRLRRRQQRWQCSRPEQPRFGQPQRRWRWWQGAALTKK